MKSFISRVSMFGVALVLGALLTFNGYAMAEGEGEQSEEEQIMAAATSISISPVSKILQLLPDTEYEDTFKVTNNGTDVMPFEVYAAPYSYSYSEESDSYQLGFSQENTYTQIVRWITFKDKDGKYVTKAKFQAQPGEEVEVSYKISTPSSMPSGGQYAVLFAHTLSENVTASGIKTEASPGLVVYGRSNGDTVTTSEIRDLSISQAKEVDGEKKSLINASAKVKNTGNVDFMAQGKLRVEGIFGRSYYETEGTQGRTSVIPETELTVSDTWEETPYFGLFKATWTVSAAGNTETISQLILILPLPILVAIILLLTFIIIWIIIFIRKRKERKSRFMI